MPMSATARPMLATCKFIITYNKLRIYGELLGADDPTMATRRSV